MKEELIAGAWYKTQYNNYFKFEKNENGWNYFSEKIVDKIWGPGAGWEGGLWLFLELKDLTEIQKFLPLNHPDLFINKPLKNENLDYLIPILTKLDK